ncbi:hypothetical protein C1H46_045803 [Malus baccata]|uniref:Uncharacterized protein n=1 Tax=Malus baccata TaxID=106549 RepID=A0A540K311_MALBA|nr:hypothetical protein C1H46_045803 [Malus baccata]
MFQKTANTKQPHKALAFLSFPKASNLGLRSSKHPFGITQLALTSLNNFHHSCIK